MLKITKETLTSNKEVSSPNRLGCVANRNENGNDCNGVKVITTELYRLPQRSFLPQIKSLNYLPNILVKRDAMEKHAFDGLMFNSESYVTEATTSKIGRAHV